VRAQTKQKKTYDVKANFISIQPSAEYPAPGQTINAGGKKRSRYDIDPTL
jgi:hypothetical protein